MAEGILGASFRDPSGFLFERDGVLYRQVDRSCADDYAALMESGLYEELVRERLLVAHEEVQPIDTGTGDLHRTLRPERLPFISYPYEWSFSALKDAAKTTLDIQLAALRHGMTLKDASAYNIQFHRGRPVFIDTLSFARRTEGSPWVGYRQFCQHFLAPLALMARRDVRLSQLLRVHLDGIPLDLASALLPRRAWLNLHLLMHIRVHARFQKRYEGDARATERSRPVTSRALANLVTALRSAVDRLEWKPEGTEWAEYYDGDSYTDTGSDHKRELVSQCLDVLKPACLWDLGANTGVFSRLASARGIPTLSFDIDPACVERNYREVRKTGEENILPLLLDLANPSPGIGWAHKERESVTARSNADTVMALALIHHLAISNNVPLDRIADFFAGLAPNLIIEFVPKSDPKVKTLLATREDVFPHYTQEGFEAAFQTRFHMEAAMDVRDSDRRLYRLKRK